ncbi:MAG: ribonuclease HII [Treponema sp.]|jgi:ribonuclease HII|nr:ribonuclease HII [Treponema sp.]
MICGIDEAGRGPLAGPVCAAAVILPNDFPVELLDDSKKLKAARREELRQIICDKAYAWGLAWATHTEIDEINILQASLLAMKRAVEQMLIGTPPSAAAWPSEITVEIPFGSPLSHAQLPELSAIVDGLHKPQIPIPCTAMVKADAKIPSVMAASILAKTARDQLMDYYDKCYPEYAYKKHKGYPTKEHRERVFKYGPSPIQRISFRVTKI